MIQLNRQKFMILLLSAGFFFVSLLGASPVRSEENGTTEDTQQAESRKGFLDPEQKKQMALAESLEEHEKVWLDVQYPEMESPRQVLAIARSSLLAETHGAILLLHDKEQHADWPQIIRPVRMGLPKWGWFTLSVNLPDELRMQQPEREFSAKEYDQIRLSDALKKNLESGSRVRNEPVSENASSAEETDSAAEDAQAEKSAADESVDINLAAASQEEKPKIPYTLRAISHIEKAMAYLRNQNYQAVIMFVSRQSSELALEYIKKHQTELVSPGFALVMLEPNLPELYIQDLSKWIGTDFKPPVLDIVDSDDARADSHAELRKLAFERAGTQNYRQIFMPISNSKPFHDSLNKRVRLWLEKVIPGVKSP